MFEKTSTLMEKIIESGVPGTDIIIYHKGKQVYRSYRGYSDIENKIAMNGKERYNLYSCSKPITCVAALQLVERGLLELDAPLYKYIPEFKVMHVKRGDDVDVAKNPITVRHLFTMSAGFSYDTQAPSLMEAFEDTNGKCPTVETIKYLSREPLLFEPGTMWEYGLSHDVLAAVVEVVSGMRFGKYVRKNIFKPLGMNDSTFLLLEDEMDTVCEQYSFEDERGELERYGKEIVNYKLGSEYESGGAGCISTVDDYIKFLEALRVGDVILKKSTIDEMCVNILPEMDDANYWPKENGYGYGLGVRCPNGASDKTDFGWGGLAGAYLAVDRENEMTLFYAQHVFNLSRPDGRESILGVVLEEIKELK